MTFRLSFLISADARTAKTELAATAAEAKKAATAATDLGRRGKETAAGTGALAGSADLASDQVRELANAQTTAAVSAANFGRSNKIAAGQMGNLTAQFNDIGVMLASGQNPLTLALQQGTQISQVIGPMGAAGALKALRGAFLGMLNPIGLITIGTIAAGAALTQWLMSGSEKAGKLGETIDDLTGGVDAYNDALDRLKTPLSEIHKEFGDQAEEVQSLYKGLADLARIEAISAMDTAVGKIKSQLNMVATEITLLNGYYLENQAGNAEVAIARRRGILRDEFGLTEQQARDVVVAFDELEKASGFDEIAAAAGRLRTIFVDVANQSGKVPPAMMEVVNAIAETEHQAQRLAGPLREAAKAGEDLNRTNMSDGINEAAEAAIRAAGEIRRAVAAIDSMQHSGASALRESEIRLQFADNPVKLAGELARQRMRDIQAPLRERADLGDAEALERDVALAGELAEKTEANNQARLKLTATTRQGSKATAEQTDAVAGLIAQQELELAILREHDPVQKGMLRLRETLANATDAEREKVEQLIAARLQEAEISKSMSEAYDFLGDAAFEALDGLILKGRSASEVMDNLKNAILQAALQALILGKGPLAGLFGISGPIWGGKGAAAAAGGMGGGGTGLAAGGMVHGPGTGTSDEVPIWASNGEFMMNARATARHRHLLEAMNAGSPIAGYAQGGRIGAAPAGSTGGGAAGPTTVRVELGQGLVGEILGEAREQSVELVRTGLGEYDRAVLPGRVRQVSADKRRVG